MLRVVEGFVDSWGVGRRGGRSFTMVERIVWKQDDGNKSLVQVEEKDHKCMVVSNRGTVKYFV